MLKLRESRSRGDRSKIATAPASLGGSKVQTEMFVGETGRLQATMALNETPSSLRDMRDDEDAEVTIRSKIESLKQSYTLLFNQTAETKHDVAVTKNDMAEVKDQLKTIAKMLEKQLIQFDSKEFATSQYPGTSIRQYEVRLSNLEQNRNNSQLGYRAGDVKVANSDNVIQESKMPMFNGKNLDDWIEKVEGFFSFMGCGDEIKLDLVHFCFQGDALHWFRRVIRKKRFKVWDDFKQELRDQFGHVTCSPVEVNLEHALLFSRRNVHESDMVEKPSPTAETVSVQFDDCPVHNCSSQTVMLRNDSHNESDQSIADEVSLDDAEFSNTIIHETEVRQVANSVFLEETVNDMSKSWSEIVTPVSVEEVSVNSTPVITHHALQDTAVSLLPTDFVVQPHQNEISCFMDSVEASQHWETEIMRGVQEANSPMMGVITEKSDVAGSSLMYTCCVSDLVSSKENNTTTSEEVKVMTAEESETIPQYWSGILKPAIMDETYEYSGDQTAEILTLSQLWMSLAKIQGAHSLLKPKTYDRCKQEKTKMSLASKSWMFKFKQGKQHKDVSRSVNTLMDDSVGRFQVKHKWRFKQINQVSVLEVGLKQVMAESCWEVSFLEKRIMSPVDKNHFPVLLDHKRVVLQWTFLTETRDQSRVHSAVDVVVFPPDLPISVADESLPIILISSSLWASLSLRVGVYKGRLTCLLIVDRLMWLVSPVWKTDVLVKYLRKQNEETGMVSQCW